MDMKSIPMSRDHSDTPPINIVAPAPVRMMGSVAMPNAGLLAEKLDHEKVRSKAARRKRNKKRAMKPGAPATTTVRGFHTPVTSGGEESDISRVATPNFLAAANLDISSVKSSPALRPMSSNGSGISALTLQMGMTNLSSPTPERPASMAALRNMASISSSASMTSEVSACDSNRTEIESYQVNFEDDFISPDVPSKPAVATWNDSPHSQSVTRKMTANDFEQLSCLGKGSFGTVLLVKQRCTGKLFAQKQFRKASLTIHKKLVEQTKTERSILESVNRHPFIVNLFYAFQDQEKLYLILEYAQGGELFHHLAMEHMFSEEVAAFYMAEVVLALDHLHNTVGVVYRDLKPENCLLSADGHLLLTDFGLSKVALDDDDRCSSFAGTVEYMAPEVVQGLKYGPAVDWWSLGALGFDLLTGSSPFRANCHAKTQEKILRQKLVMPYFLGPDSKDLLTRLLRKDANKRLGSHMPRDLQTIKKHRFFRKIDWQRLARRELEPPIKPLITDPELAENFSTTFTELPLSPVMSRGDGFDIAMDGTESLDHPGPSESDPFGGFSFVASSSLFENGCSLLL
jgi:serine/threonine protein kinase